MLVWMRQNPALSSKQRFIEMQYQLKNWDQTDVLPISLSLKLFLCYFVVLGGTEIEILKIRVYGRKEAAVIYVYVILTN